MQGVEPLYLVDYGTVHLDEQGVMEELHVQGGLDLSDCIPVGWAEIGAESKSYLEKEVLCKDMQEGPNYVRVMICLAKAGFGIIGVDDNVFMQIKFISVDYKQ